MTTTPNAHPANGGAIVFSHQQGLSAHFPSYFTFNEKKVVHIDHHICQIGPVYKTALTYQSSALSV